MFAEAFEGDPEFAVPAVLAGTEHVIVSEWLEGKPLSRIIADGPPAERNAASQLSLGFLIAGPAYTGILPAAPHPANSRLTPHARPGYADPAAGRTARSIRSRTYDNPLFAGCSRSYSGC